VVDLLRARRPIARFVFGAGALILMPLLTACSGLPTSGPSAKAILAEDEPYTSLPYARVDLNGEVATILHDNPPVSLRRIFGHRGRPASVLFDVGDVVGVTIFESASGGLFLPSEGGSRPGNYVQLPDQIVDRNGNISVPYAGIVKIRGRSAIQVQKQIQARLSNRAIEPQAIVTLREQRSAFVSVLGEVNTPGRFALSAAGERLSDVIARAGGPRARGYETFITVERKGERATVNLMDLVDEPSNDIFMQPGDTLFVKSEARTFMAFGATGESGQFDFEKERITLAEAIGKAKGLLDERAEPASVFLYRNESAERARLVGVDMQRWGSAKSIPVIYWLNLRDPAGFLIAGRVPMRPADVIYIGNASGAEFAKFMHLLQGNVAVGTGVRSITR
jgi:polysaccharide export outer membrane protein